MPDFIQLATSLGIRFRRIEFLEEACTHRSYLNEHPKYARSHNERLEFLGDAVLELIVTEALFRQNLQAQEGELTNLRAALVRAETLAAVARDLNVNEYLLLSRGEAKDIGRARDAILANTIEAIIGAIFMDQGFAAAEKFVIATVLAKLPGVLAAEGIRDPKSRFQEAAQDQMGITPHYAVLKEWGPDHARRFQVGAYLGEELIGEGEGASKQEAQQAAAAAALRSKKWDQ